MKINLWQKSSQSFLLGCLLIASLPPFTYSFIVPFVFTSFLLLLLRAPSGKEAFKMGFLFGMGYFICGLYWVTHALLLDNSFYWLTFPALFLLPAYLSLYLALPAFITWKVRFKNPYIICLTWATSITFGEMLRGSLLSGFPWNPFGVLFSSSLSFLQSATFFGMYGLTFLAILFSASFLLLFKPFKHIKSFLFFISLTLFFWGYGFYRLETNPPTYTSIPVTLVQPNIPQHPFFSLEEKRHNLLKIARLTQSITPLKNRIIIWPESAVPFALNHLPQLQKDLRKLLYTTNTLILGSIRVEKSDNNIKLFNSLYAFSPDRVEGIYDKIHLLPFGEFIPFSSIIEKYISLKALTGGGMNFSSGNRKGSLSLPSQLPSVKPYICYEAIFPKSQINKKKRPKWIVNITNDAWFGKSTGPYQHLQLSRIRAIEEGAPLVRVATTGISAIIDPYGRIIKHTSLNKQSIITGYLPESLTYSPLFSIYTQIPLFLFISLLWCLFFVSIVISYGIKNTANYNKIFRNKISG